MPPTGTECTNVQVRLRERGIKTGSRMRGTENERGLGGELYKACMASGY